MERGSLKKRQIRHVKTSGRNARVLARNSHTMFLFIVAFASVILLMTSRMLRNVKRTPVKVYVRIQDKDILLVNALPDEIVEDLSETQTGNAKKNMMIATSQIRQKNVLATKQRVAGPETDVSTDTASVCKKPSIFLLALIFSEEPMTSLRNLIRQTWCKLKTYSQNRQVTCLFVVGQSPRGEPFSNETLKESQHHHDVLLTSLLDDIRNSTRKLLTGLKWIKSNCPNVRYVLRTEDDVIINMHQLVENTLPGLPSEKFVGGLVTIDRPVRVPYSQYYVSVKEYPFPQFPPKCDSRAYLISGDVVQDIVKSSKTSGIIALDDVYMAISSRKLGISPQNINKFIYVRSLRTLPYAKDIVCNHTVVHVHIDTFKHVRKVWEAMRNECVGT
ncbi:beta-1,3-galactosyltransferase 5-like isoform X2 [Clavelina lepadiformis]|uniref:Hexosyltransferase n=1 Tax=Clavelina lepadiformis TaxID=159417 RepID=A0ABP0H4A0_CLALP